MVTLGRVPIRDVQSLDDVMVFVESTDGENVIVFDVDNTLAPQGAQPPQFGHLVNSAIDRFEASPCIARVIALTNGPQRQVPRMISRGNKPWTTRGRLGLRDSDAPLVVVGDQVLTDGLLAWRLRATFLHLVLDDDTEDRRQTIMRRIGSIVTVMLFRHTLPRRDHRPVLVAPSVGEARESVLGRRRVMVRCRSRASLGTPAPSTSSTCA